MRFAVSLQPSCLELDDCARLDPPHSFLHNQESGSGDESGAGMDALESGSPVSDLG